MLARNVARLPRTPGAQLWLVSAPGNGPAKEMLEKSAFRGRVSRLRALHHALDRAIIPWSFPPCGDRRHKQGIKRCAAVAAGLYSATLDDELLERWA